MKVYGYRCGRIPLPGQVRPVKVRLCGPGTGVLVFEAETNGADEQDTTGKTYHWDSPRFHQPVKYHNDTLSPLVFGTVP